MFNGIFLWVFYLTAVVLTFFVFLFYEKRTDEFSRFGVVVCTFLSLIWPITILLICILIPVMKLAELLSGVYSKIVESKDN